MKKASNWESFRPFGRHGLHVLLSLAAQERHGYGIMQEVLERTDGQVRLWPATLYGTLKRLIDEGLIEESDKRPAPEHDDARRRYYRLSKLGRRALVEESARLEDVVRMIRATRGLRKAES